MIKSGSLKRKLTQFAFLSFIVFAINYFVPAFNPDSEAKRDRRIQINVGRIGGTNYVEGEVLVKFKQQVSRHTVDAIAQSSLSTVIKRFKALTKIDTRQYAHFKSKIKTTQQMMQQLQKLPEIEAVSPNYLLHVDSTIPNDQYFSYLWGLHNTGQMGGPPNIDIDAPEAWDMTTGSSNVIVAVIDTGIDYNHPDLIPNIWINPGEVVDGVDNDGNGYIDDMHGINAITQTGDPMDDHSHGTHCAGTIGAVGDNSLGVVGVNWNVKLIGTKFLDATGYGTEADAIECINYLIDLKTTHGQNIVAANASFGGGSYDPVMESAIDNMGTAGIVFCAAAGNDYLDNDITPHYPSSYPCSNIIAVTAVDYMGWQNFNYGATSVDLAAPGVEILSTISAVYYPQAEDIFFDDMESGSGNWITGGVNNSWAITIEQELFENPSFPVPSPPHFWSDSPDADYLPDTDSWLMNATDIDLSAYVGQELYIGFGSAMLFEPLIDHAYVEVSGDGGSTWHSLMDYSTYPIYWYIPLNLLIPDFVKTANFRFRFHLVTDFSIEYAGWLIDNVGIGTADYYAYGYKSGTSMATPHVTGAVALLASQNPSETVAGRINRILNNVTLLPSLVGTCVTEGMLNLSQAVAYLPAIPENPSPPDGATGIPIDTDLDWDDSLGATSYDVYFGATYPPPFVSTETTSHYDPGVLSPGAMYYWKITAKNASGENPGPEWKFVTQGTAPCQDYPDFNRDGNADILWRYYGTGGYNAVWLRGSLIDSSSSSPPVGSLSKVNSEIMETENNQFMPKPDEQDMRDMTLSIPEIRELGIKDGFEDLEKDKGDKPKLMDDPFAMEKKNGNQPMSHIMALTVDDPRNDPQAVELPSAANTLWKLCGTGDFNDDDHVDLVWRHAGDGRNAVWFMDGFAMTGVALLPTAANLNWTLSGTGDFNDDGLVDLVWRHAGDGRNAVWFMDGITMTGVALLPTAVDLNWTLCGTGDFNNDGHVDLVWRHMGDGRNAVWFMDGITMTGVALLPTASNLNWTLSGTGDFNNDQRVDLLWRNVSDGKNAIWYLDGINLTSVESLTTVTNAQWKIEN